MTLILLLAGVGGLFLLSALVAPFPRLWGSGRAIYVAVLAICLFLLLAAGSELLWPEAGGQQLRLPLGLPWLGAHLRLDALSAFFLLVVSLGGTAASLFAFALADREEEPARLLPFFPAFLGAMGLVPLADDAFTFLFAWELMSLFSWALVLAHHHAEESAPAGRLYLLLAAFGTLSLLLALGLAAGPEGDYAFAELRGKEQSAGIAAAVFLLALLGTGSKAGLLPLHVWLPLAHAAAPSPVSALMSGVMTKIAVYGFLRIAFDLLGAPQWWWAAVLLPLGAATALYGILSALLQRDMKRVLAYSTIENLGFIFLAIGLAAAFEADGFALAGALALTAALFHVLNHALFKSLLFLGAGAVLSASGTRDLEQLGGLIHRLPETALAMLAGAVAISALPPFNGFVSEWLAFQAILLSPELRSWPLVFLAPAVGAALALAAALAAACFLRLFGIAFLGRPRSPAAAAAREVPRSARAVLLGLAVLCLLLGVFPNLLLDGLQPVTTLLLGARLAVQSGDPWFTLVPIETARSSYSGFLVLLFIAFSAGLAALIARRFAAAGLRRAPPWDCGQPLDSARTQYAADSLSQPLRRVFAGLSYRLEEVVFVPPPGSLAAASFRLLAVERLWQLLYLPLASAIAALSDRMNALQFLTIRRYLTLVFVALVTLLLLVALWR